MSKQVCRYEGGSKIQISMEGIKDVVKVLALDSFDGHSLSSLLQCCFRSLRQLCLENIQLLEDISGITQLQALEILSFYQSVLVHFPKEVEELKNLKLLDLRFEHFMQFPSGIFLGLRKLEELYMGYYDIREESIEEVKQGWIIEARSLSNLTTFQIRGEPTTILLVLRYLDAKKMERFEILQEGLYSISYDEYEYEYEVERCMELSNGVLKVLLTPGSEEDCNIANTILLLVKKSNILRLMKIEGIKNVVPGLDEDWLTNVKTLELNECDDMEYIVDSFDMRKWLLLNQRDMLRNMEKLIVIGCKNLKALFRCGRIQPGWLPNLKFVKIEGVEAITSLFSLSRLSLKFFPPVEELRISYCSMLEKVIDIELEDIEEEEHPVMKLPHLRTLRVHDFKKLKGFYLANNDNNNSQALFSQVSLPALKELRILYGELPQNIVGTHMPKGSLDNLRIIRVECCIGLTSIAKADSLTLLENLNTIYMDAMRDVEVLFDFEGLKVTQTQGLQLLGQLSSLFAYEMPRLTSLWRMFPPTGVQAFQNLKNLVIADCISIQYLLPLNIIHMLVSLEDMTIATCPSMEDVIINCFEEGSSGVLLTPEHKDHYLKKQFVFPKLNTILLEDLEMLRSFSPAQDFSLIFPSLTVLKIRGCPQLKRFSYGNLSAPNLKSLEGDIIPTDFQEFKARKEGDIN